MSCQCKCLTIRGESGNRGRTGWKGKVGFRGCDGPEGPLGICGFDGRDGDFGDVQIYGIGADIILEYWFECMVYDQVLLFKVNIRRVIVTWMLRYLKKDIIRADIYL